MHFLHRGRGGREGTFKIQWNAIKRTVVIFLTEDEKKNEPHQTIQLFKHAIPFYFCKSHLPWHWIPQYKIHKSRWLGRYMTRPLDIPINIYHDNIINGITDNNKNRYIREMLNYIIESSWRERSGMSFGNEECHDNMILNVSVTV